MPRGNAEDRYLYCLVVEVFLVVDVFELFEIFGVVDVFFGL